MHAFTFMLFAIAFSAPAGPQPTDPATPLPSIALPPELDRVLREYERAWQARDAQALSELFAEDSFVLADGRLPVRGRTAIRATYSGSGGPLSLRALAFATADTVGYIIGGFARTPTAPDVGKFVLALRRNEAGRWLIMADIDNPNERRPSPAPVGSPTPLGD